MRCNPDIKTKIVIVGPDAQSFIDAHQGNYPNAEFVAAEKPPEDGTPYVFTDPELQLREGCRREELAMNGMVSCEYKRKAELSREFPSRFTAILDEAPDPVDYNNNPRNRRERRALAAKSRRRR